jgi:hypothetical protein
VLGFPREQFLDGGVAQRGGTRPATLRIRLHLRERVLDLLAVLVAVALIVVLPVLLSLPFFLLLYFFGTGARMDVSEVERVRLGKLAQVKGDDDPPEMFLIYTVPLTPESCSGRRSRFALLALFLWGAWSCSAWESPPPHPTSKKIAESTPTEIMTSRFMR